MTSREEYLESMSEKPQFSLMQDEKKYCGVYKNKSWYNNRFTQDQRGCVKGYAGNEEGDSSQAW
jgi:hypothetical protein